MADFLIKNTNHWMDNLPTEELIKRILEDEEFRYSYTLRYQKGDVLEVAKDNRWKDNQHGNGKFIIVRVPLLSLEEAQEFIQPIVEISTNIADEPVIKIIKRRRYRLWFETIEEEEFTKHRTSEYVYELGTLEELQLFGQDKTDEE